MHETLIDTMPDEHWTPEQIIEVWNKGTKIREYDSSRKRDKCGRAMNFIEHGRKHSNFGWEIDFIIAVANGGNECIDNLQPLANSPSTLINNMVDKVIGFVEEISARSKTRSEFDRIFIDETNRLIYLIKPNDYSYENQINMHMNHDLEGVVSELKGNGRIDNHDQIENRKYDRIFRFVMNIRNSKSF
jgi:hypothetical protein